MKSMTNQRNANWLPVFAIAGALIGWMAVLAIGAYWAPVGSGPGGDPRKLLVVAATTGGFLLLWGVVLAVRQRKLRQKSADSEESEGREAPNE